MNTNFRLLALSLFVFTSIHAHAQSITPRGEWIAPPSPPATNGPAQVTIDGNFAYLLSATGYLQIVDITDRTRPSLVGGTNLTEGLSPAFANHSVVYGNFLYAAIATSAEDFHVVDITDRAHPSIVRTVKINAYAQTVAVDGARLFVGSNLGLRAYDLADPANPEFLGDFKTTNWVHKVAVRDNLAYMAMAGSGLVILDVTDPQVMLRVGGAWANVAIDLALQGDYAYVLGSLTYQQLVIFDIRNPVSPSPVGATPLNLVAKRLAVSGGTAVLVNDVVANGGAIRTFDVSNVTNPREISGPQGKAAGVAASSSDFFFACKEAGLIIMDLSNPTDPIRKGIFGTPLSLSSVVVNGSHGYVANRFGGVLVFDLSNPDNPRQIGDFLPRDQQISLALTGTNLLAVANRRIDIYNVTNPAVPNFSGSYRTTSGIWSLAASGNYVYAQLDGGPNFEGLLVVDISNPTAPTKASLFKQGFNPLVAADGSAVYTSGGTINLLNASNPASLSLVISKPSSAYASTIKLAGSLLLAARDGLRVYTAGLGGNLTLLGNHPGTGPSIISPGDNRAFLVNGPSLDEIEVVDLRTPALPRRAAIRNAGRSLIDLVGVGSRAYSISANALQIWDTTLGEPVAENIPVLQVFRDGGNVIIRWPSLHSDFTLQSSLDLKSPWDLVTSNPGTDGANFSVTNRFPLGTSKFYRLIK